MDVDKAREAILNVKPSDHPDLVGGIVWSAMELSWINTHGLVCYDYGYAKGIETGKTLYSPKSPTNAAIVTKDMITAAHGVTIESGDVILSASLLEKIYIAMAEQSPRL